MISEKLWCPAGVEKLSSIQLALLQNTETVLATSASIWYCSEFTSICFTSKFSFTFFAYVVIFKHGEQKGRVYVIPVMFLLGIVEAHFLCWKNGRVILQIDHYSCLCVCFCVLHTSYHLQFFVLVTFLLQNSSSICNRGRISFFVKIFPASTPLHSPNFFWDFCMAAIDKGS